MDNIIGKTGLSISEFAKKINEMVAVNTGAYNTSYIKRMPSSTETAEDIKAIIDSGSADQIVQLSEKFAGTSGLYSRIIAYLSNFLTNDVFVTPKKITNKSINQKKYLENYKKAVFFADTTINPKLNFPHLMFKILIYGAYYGIFIEDGEMDIVLRDLPNQYCRSRFKTFKNVNVLEFDMSYFDSITDDNLRKQALAEFPKEFTKAYNAYKRDMNLKWFVVPPEYGVAFYYQEQSKPLFISMIPTIVNLEEYRSLEKKLDKQELEKVLVQEVPIDKEGNFMLSGPEVGELHRGVVNMLKNNQSTDVLTTFAKVTMLNVGDKTKADRDNLEKIERSVYTEAGVSRLLFSSDSATSVNQSIINDMSLALAISEQFANWLTYQTNLRYSENSKYYFEVNILPISHYNREEMLDLYLKTAQYGYSKIMVGIATGIKQSSFIDLMELENDVLKLHDNMMPLQSSHTAAGGNTDEGGRPEKKIEDKEEKTVQNEEGM